MHVFATFKKGGVHPQDRKQLSSSQKTVRLPLPDELLVPMSQHIGAPAVCLKKPGESVEKGEKIGEAASFVSANVHSPVRGIVKDIRKITLSNGNLSDAVLIVPDENQPDLYTKRLDYSSLSSVELLNSIKEAGITGMGGASFPAHVKLSIPEGKHVDALVINAVECEPYLTADHRTLLERTEDFLEGIEICKKILNPIKTIIGVEANKMDAVALLNSVIQQKNLNIKVQPLKMKYPQGDEKQLLKATINREIPSGKLPIDVGGVIINTGSVLAVFEAVVYGKPLIERTVTVSGECVSKPSNFIVPLGTKISYLFNAAGGFCTEPDKLISGGPMMGFAFLDENAPICKGTSGVLAIKDEKNHKQTNCISCGSCIRHCPIGLQPTKLYSLIINGQYEEAMKNNLMDCKECGCCAFSCPAHLDLVHAFKLGKKMGRKK